jgi:tetratricopeptide (TPR) repeat protein
MDKEALATFGRALNREPKNVSLWLDLIRIFEQKKNSHLALNILQRALEQNPENEILAAKREKILHSSIPG